MTRNALGLSAGLLGALVLLGGAAFLLFPSRRSSWVGADGPPQAASSWKSPETEPDGPAASEAVVAGRRDFVDSEAAVVLEARADSAGAGCLGKGMMVSRVTSTSACLYGTWTSGSGEGNPHQRIRVHRLDHGGAGQAVLVVATDVGGRYAADLEPGRYRLQFGPDRYEVELQSGEERRLDHRDPAEEAGLVRIRVLPGEHVVADQALVTLAAAGGRQVMQARTGMDGTAVFGNVRPGAAEVLGRLQRRGEPGTVGAREAVDVASGVAVELTLREPPGRMLVHCLDNGRRPIVGAEVLVFVEGATAAVGRAFSGEDGIVSLAALPIGPCTLATSHRDYVPAIQMAEIEETGRAVGVVLDSGSRVRVKVADEMGRPMAIVLRAWSVGEVRRRNWEWRLDENGEGWLDRIPTGEAMLEFLAAGFAPQRRSVAEITAGPEFCLRFQPLHSGPR
jgi:hypothetical protein